MKKETLLMYAASEQDADLYYATRFKAPDPVLYLRIRGKSTLILSDLEYARGLRQARVDSVLRFSEIARRSPHGSAALKDAPSRVAADFCRSKGVRRVWVPSGFPLLMARRLESRGITVAVKDGPFFERRSQKMREEVSFLTQALRSTEKALHKAERALWASRIRGGHLVLGTRVLTSERLRGILHVALAEDGLTAAHTIVACGRAACDPHEEGSGPLRPHQSIVIDVFPRSSETLYWADITRTFVKGKAKPVLRRMYEAVEQAQASALRTVREGARACDVHRAAVGSFEERGMFTRNRRGIPVGFIHGTGHGVGLEIHEPPRLNASSDRHLRRGEVVTVEPGWYDPDLGGVRLEDMVLVRKGACLNLTRYPKRFEIP